MTDRSPTMRRMSRLVPALVAGLVLTACAGDEGAGPPVAAAPVAAVADQACGQVEAPASDIPGWPLMPEGSSAFLPVVTSQLLTVGPSRFLYRVVDPAGAPLPGEAPGSRIDFYDLGRDPETPVASAEASHLETPVGGGLYRASVDLDCPGEWGAAVTIDLDDGTVATGRMRFQVHAEGPMPAVGDPAPRSESPTAATPQELRRVSTDPEPHAVAYERSVAEVVTDGRPSLVLFATPAFCRTGHCGPMVDVVKAVATEHEDSVSIVIVEPYELHMTENGLQPLLGEDGWPQPVQAVLDYGLPLEPYLFLVDAQGDVFAAFEGVVGADELRAAIGDVLAAA